jgi:hypothetical protein
LTVEYAGEIYEPGFWESLRKLSFGIYHRNSAVSEAIWLRDIRKMIKRKGINASAYDAISDNELAILRLLWFRLDNLSLTLQTALILSLQRSRWLLFRQKEKHLLAGILINKPFLVLR